MTNVNRPKAPQTSATHTLKWIARIHSHTYINIVTTTFCEAPAHLIQNLEPIFHILKVPEEPPLWIVQIISL